MQQGLRIILLLILIACAIILSCKYPEGFYDGQISNPYLYPLAYNLAPQQYPQGPQQYMPQGPQVAMNPYMQQCPQTLNGLAAPSGAALGPDASAPMMYPAQLYPKLPWYPNTGKPCVQGECGATGTCTNGFCKPNIATNTAFGTPIIG
jgi:hypothetical protein